MATAGRARRVLLAVALALPASAAALEPRFDHRDTYGPLVEVLLARDSVSVSGRGTTASWRPALRASWGFDVTGEGSELLLGGDVALRSFDDPDRERVLVAASARYRSYFGTEELKTFFELGLYAPLRSRLAAGPLVGLGLAYDFSRASGVFVAAEFASAFGQARLVSGSVLAGAQIRFEVPFTPSIGPCGPKSTRETPDQAVTVDPTGPRSPLAPRGRSGIGLSNNLPERQLSLPVALEW
jgi:hypothetical protein